MVRPIPIFHESESFSAIAVALGLFVSVSVLVGLCAKHAKQIGRKESPKSGHPLPSPKQLMAAISQKAMSPLIHSKKAAAAADSGEENGVWQKAILMGEKCQPPEFSGVIYYDYDGKRIPEMPKSPRHGSMTPLKNISFPQQKNEASVY
ncbi:uncharacterized protein LOC125206438 [Salvia hispanica]|uniref:uncharacterized protein LOC125199140 n=1 Tax=Salvia hispanica TaxID=49212 RepID=UPI002009A11F|nr:uncharacterized protein LOC125199140 [Salvia hispanica]XP_047961650.1 uncharacterized protein LOC125206438 [Salvia hispanica]